MTINHTPKTILSLPPELIQQITGHLEGESAHNAAQAAKVFTVPMSDDVWLKQYASQHPVTQAYLPLLPAKSHPVNVVHRVAQARVWSDLFHPMDAKALEESETLRDKGFYVRRELQWVEGIPQQRINVRGNGLKAAALLGGPASFSGEEPAFKTVACAIIGASVLTMASREDGSVTAKLHATAISATFAWQETPAAGTGLHQHGPDIWWRKGQSDAFEVFARIDHPVRAP